MEPYSVINSIVIMWSVLLGMHSTPYGNLILNEMSLPSAIKSGIILRNPNTKMIRQFLIVMD